MHSLVLVPTTDFWDIILCPTSVHKTMAPEEQIKIEITSISSTEHYNV